MTKTIILCNNKECPSKETCLLFGYIATNYNIKYEKYRLKPNQIACDSYLPYSKKK